MIRVVLSQRSFALLRMTGWSRGWCVLVGRPSKKTPHQNLSHQNLLELIRTYPIRTHQNPSEPIRTHQNLSELIKEFKEISEIKESADRTEKTP